jgi:hypothetical protein
LKNQEGELRKKLEERAVGGKAWGRWDSG